MGLMGLIELVDGGCLTEMMMQGKKHKHDRKKKEKSGKTDNLEAVDWAAVFRK